MWNPFRRPAAPEAPGGAVSFGGSLAAAKLSPPEPAKPRAEHQTAADTLNWICEKYGAKYVVDTAPNGNVRLTVDLADGDRVSGIGKTTKDALGVVLQRLGEVG